MQSSDAFGGLSMQRGRFRTVETFCDTCRETGVGILVGVGPTRMTGPEYYALSVAQNHRCAICGTPQPERLWSRDKKRLSIDHDHLTGAIRGLLCGACNSGLGLLKDDLTRLVKAVQYLQKPPASVVHTGNAQGLEQTNRFLGHFGSVPQASEPEEPEEPKTPEPPFQAKNTTGSSGTAVPP